MSDIFVSYARSTEAEARRIAEALRALGHGVWRDDELPAHRVYAEAIEERLKAAKAVIVVWSAEAVKSQWVRAEANLAREAGTLLQLRAMRLDPIGADRSVRMGWLGIGRFRQGRFGEAVAGLKEWVQQADVALGYAYLAASYGHPGQLTAAREAMARYSDVTTIRLQDLRDSGSRVPGEQMYDKLFFDGVALAEGKVPADGPAGVSR